MKPGSPRKPAARKKASAADPGTAAVLRWFTQQNWEPQEFQLETWAHMLHGRSGLLNAATGTGKTYAIWGGIVARELRDRALRDNGKKAGTPAQGHGLRVLWITPLRALASEIADAARRMCDGMGLQWTVGSRTGDTRTKERAAQKKQMPQLLVTTPESLHVLLATKGHADLFKHLDWLVVDEWHELLGSKRGVLLELGASRLRALRPDMASWGISATIGNLDEALEVLVGPKAFARADRFNTTPASPHPPASPRTSSQGDESGSDPRAPVLVRSSFKKPMEVRSILPDSVEHYPWAGHLGLKLAPKLLPVIEESTSTLVFTNTRAQAEIWYHHLLDLKPDLAGLMALHHGSLDRSIREWVETALDEGRLKAVVCTSSLDLGVDFRPVETVVQVGGPKGVARFVQRAGRSGHRPDATSRIWFLPTHALELVEAAALRIAAGEGSIEARQPLMRCFDVLAQYMVTLAVSDGFDPRTLLAEVAGTHCFKDITVEEWQWLVNFITTGGKSLRAYEEFAKAGIDPDGTIHVRDRRIALRHRMSIGTITSYSSYVVKYVGGGRIGSVEEWFINQLGPGDTFWFAGRALEFVRVKDLTVQVRRSKRGSGRIPSWEGGRMPLSSYMAKILRQQLNSPPPEPGSSGHVEMAAVQPILVRQRETSMVPSENELLIERFKSREGHHVVVYPFEGRLVNETLGALLAFRMSLLKPISFSIAMNDYGFELLSDQPIPIEEALDNELFSPEHLLLDLQRSLNSTEMARRKFRDIATIAGLVFTGYPGRPMKEKHLRGNSSLFFEVFQEHEPDHLLLRQAYDEAFDVQMELPRLREALERIKSQNIVLKDPGKFTPLAFPIIVDRLRDRLTSEELEDRIKKMTEKLEQG